MLRIGLTGGIASGKSMAAAEFAALGVPVIDADLIAREVVAPGAEGLARLVTRLGKSILDGQGELDRGALRARLFADATLRREVEALLHPLIRARMQTQLTACAAPYAVAVIPLLVETGQRALVDRVLVIDAPPELQRARCMARDGIDAAAADSILAAQAGRAQRLAAADEVIVNDGSPQALRAAVRELHGRYLVFAGRACNPATP